MLSGQTSERSRLYGRIYDCVFSGKRVATRKDVQQCAELVDALVDVWDGTREQAESIASVIRGLSKLTRRS